MLTLFLKCHNILSQESKAYTEKVDEDNFIFELVKENDKALVENIEKEDNEIKKEIDKLKN